MKKLADLPQLIWNLPHTEGITELGIASSIPAHAEIKID